MEYKLSPSLLSADFGIVKEQLEILENAGTPYIHLDVMDGVFVPNISFGIPVIKSLRKHTKMIFDAHLMIIEPERYIKEFYEIGCDIINIHAEATKDLKGTIEKINSYGVKSGVTIKPKTPVSAIYDVLSDVDMVLIMSVEPGFGGQKFMPEQLEKARELKRLKDENGYKYDIQIDGGITLDNLREVLDAGVNCIFSGSSVLGKEDIGQAAKDFMEVFKEY